jgi:hypothetical protein
VCAGRLWVPAGSVRRRAVCSGGPGVPAGRLRWRALFDPAGCVRGRPCVRHCAVGWGLCAPAGRVCIGGLCVPAGREFGGPCVLAGRLRWLAAAGRVCWRAVCAANGFVPVGRVCRRAVCARGSCAPAGGARRLEEPRPELDIDLNPCESESRGRVPGLRSRTQLQVVDGSGLTKKCC